MTYFRLTIKNYRCFTDENPLVIEFNEGFTALVGPNNSGKSSFLKMFYEFKNLWNTLIQGQTILNLFNGASISVNYQETSDNTEIFSNFNDRPLTISFDRFVFFRRQNTPLPSPALSRAEFISEKSAPQSWKAKFKSFGGQEYDINCKDKNRMERCGLFLT